MGIKEVIEIIISIAVTTLLGVCCCFFVILDKYKEDIWEKIKRGK